jgi:hypothetical protein
MPFYDDIVETERCPACQGPDLRRIAVGDRDKHGLDPNPAKDYVRCMSCEAYLIRPAGSHDEWRLLE